jgi:long-chain acyl-CoA synthetase
MASPDPLSLQAEVPPGTLVELFLEAVDQFADHPALREFPDAGPELATLSYRAVYRQVRAVAHGLEAIGVGRGERAAILAENRPEWAIADYACLMAGVVDVPVYATLLPSQVAYILKDSGARLVFVSTREQMEKVLEASREADLVLTVVVFDEVPGAPREVVPWSRLIAEGPGRIEQVTDEEFREAALAARPDDVATILYTSGTTGEPKGVMLTHDNVFSNVNAAGQLFEISEKDASLCFLPLSHVFQRMVDYLLFSRGCSITYAHDVTTVADDLKVVRPTIAVSVPRLYEKVYDRVMGGPGLKGRIARWAGKVATAWADAKMADQVPEGSLAFRHRLADRLVYRKIRAAVGGRLRFFVSGGAPLEPAIAKFFYGAGVNILEGYGLTETSPVTNVNTLERFRIGTVGRPVPGTEVRIAEDGEILVRGRQVMKGYYNQPGETAKVLRPDGWFLTGDIGEIDDDGFLRITDRKKDLIVTAGGKNVAPQPIENRLRTNPFVEQLVLVGDRHKFVSLLVVPAFAALEAWASGKGINASERGELIRHPTVQSLLEKELLSGLDDLSSYERPKKLLLLDTEFSIDDGTLTPTQKVKRRVVQKRLGDVIDALYAEENAQRTVFAVSELAAPAEAR